MMAVEFMAPTLSWINGAEAVLLPATAAFAVLLLVSQLNASPTAWPNWEATGGNRRQPQQAAYAAYAAYAASKAPNKQCCFQSIQSCSPTQYVDRSWDLLFASEKKTQHNNDRFASSPDEDPNLTSCGKYRIAAMEIGAVTKTFTAELPNATPVVAPSLSTPLEFAVRLTTDWAWYLVICCRLSFGFALLIVSLVPRLLQQQNWGSCKAHRGLPLSSRWYQTGRLAR